MILVDDAPLLRELARVNLVFAGFDVVAEAGDADEGVTAAARLQPDVVVLDVDMPGRTGVEALPDLVSASPSSGLVVWSSVETGGVVSRVAALGAAFVRKTDDVVVLVDAVRRAAGSSPPSSSG